MDNDEFEFRLLDSSRLSELAEMFRLCFGQDVSEGYFRWKYLDSPGGEVVAFTAEREGRVAAFYGLLPERYTVGGEATTIYQSMDTMTHPDFQRRGLFVKTARTTFNHVLAQLGHLRLIGVAGENSYPGFVNKLGWKNIEKFRYVFASRPLFRARTTLVKRVDLELAPIERVEEGRFDAYFARREASPLPISPVLSVAYLNWRTFDHPYEKYEVIEMSEDGQPVGVMVGQLNDGGRYRLMLVDFRSKSMFKTHLPTAIGWLFQQPGVRTIYCWRPKVPAYREGLKRCGFTHNPFSRGPFSYRQPLITYADQPIVKGVDWYDARNFDLQPLHQV